MTNYRSTGRSGAFRQRAAWALATVTTLVTLAVPMSASAGPLPPGSGLALRGGSWNTLTLPDVSFIDDFYYQSLGNLANSFGVDAQGNVYTIPCSASFTTASDYGNCSPSAGGGGVERYSPTTGASSILDPSQNFTNLASMAVDPSGDVYLVMNSGVINEISSTGVSSVISNSTVLNLNTVPFAAATSPSGSLYITDHQSSSNVTYIKELVGTTWNTVATLNGEYSNLAVAPNGDIYVVGASPTGVFLVTPAGAVSEIPGLSGAANRYPEAVAVDASGNLYVVEEGASFPLGRSSVVVEVTPQGQQLALPPSPSLARYGWSEPDELVFAAGTLYLWDEYPYQDQSVGQQPSLLYTFNGSSTPQMTSVTATGVNSYGAPTQSVTATWTGAPGPYQCTLLYGFREPSSFTETVTTTSCTFSGLALGATYGVSVVSLTSGGPSYPATGFATAAVFSLRCAKNGHSRIFRTSSPRCPRGWRPL